MSAVRPHAEGATLAVKARPGAKRNAILGIRNDALEVSVTAPAEGGRANEAILRLLRESLGVKRSQLELLTGHASRNKAVLIRGLSAAALATAIESFA